MAAFAVKQEAFSGPIPPPQMLGEYDKIIPHGAERIMAMAESQQSHRQGLEKKVVGANVIAQYIGQFSGWSLGMAGMSGGFYLIHEGKSAEGITALIVAVGSLVGVFLIGRSGQERERKAKQESMPNNLR